MCLPCLIIALFPDNPIKQPKQQQQQSETQSHKHNHPLHLVRRSPAANLIRAAAAAEAEPFNRPGAEMKTPNDYIEDPGSARD